MDKPGSLTEVSSLKLNVFPLISLVSALIDWHARRPLSVQLDTQKNSLSDRPAARKHAASAFTKHRWKISQWWGIIWDEKLRGCGSKLRMKETRLLGSPERIIEEFGEGNKSSVMMDMCLKKWKVSAKWENRHVSERKTQMRKRRMPSALGWGCGTKM